MEALIMIQPSEARELCSKSEWELIESSFSPAVETLPPSYLKSRIGRVNKLHQKCTDLVNRQHSDSRKHTTFRKTELFAEAAIRFDAGLKLAEMKHRAEPSVSKNVDTQTEETRTLNMNALRERADREFESRKSEVLSALAVRGEQQRGQSGERRIQSHVGSVTRRQQARRDTKNS
jgi:hypothetical protein